MVYLETTYIIVATVFGGIIVGLLKDEVSAWLPSLCHKIICFAAARLPGDDRERMREEWLGHLHDLPGKLSQLWHAIGTIFASLQMTKFGKDFIYSKIMFLVQKIEQYDKFYFVSTAIFGLPYFTVSVYFLEEPIWKSLLGAHGFVCIMCILMHRLHMRNIMPRFTGTILALEKKREALLFITFLRIAVVVIKRRRA